MKKPEKFKGIKAFLDKEGKEYFSVSNLYQRGYNQAISEYEAFLPDEEEILKIIKDVFKANNIPWFDSMEEVTIHLKCAKAIAKRLKDE